MSSRSLQRQWQISQTCPLIVMATAVIPPKHGQCCMGSSHGNSKKPASRSLLLPATVLMTSSIQPRGICMICANAPPSCLLPWQQSPIKNQALADVA